MSIDSLAPYPTLDVLAAVVTTYGVDPTWLITGEYNSATHRSAVATGSGHLTESMRQLLRMLEPVGQSLPDEPPLRLVRDA